MGQGFTGKDKKFHPIGGSKGSVSEKDLNINVKGNNDVIKVDTKSNGMKSNRESDKKPNDSMLDSGKIFNLRQIKADLDGAELEPNDPFDENSDDKIQRIYAGTVYALTPSGKYYTSFASSNVSDAEMKKDEKWWKDVEKELGKIGATLESGEDNPDDLFIIRMK